MKRTVLNLLKQAVDKFESQTYIAEKSDNGWNEKSYKDVEQKSDYVASGLLNLGLQKNDKVAILAEGRNNWVIGEYGILKIGATAVPLSVKLTPEDILFRLNHSESKAILISKHNIDKLGPIWNKLETANFKIIHLDTDTKVLERIKEKYSIPTEKAVASFDEICEDGKKTFEKNSDALKQLQHEIEESDIVTISYTSGTTGNPKGIMLSHLNYFANSNDAYNYFNLEYGLKTLIILPLDHSFAHTVGIYISLVCGLSIYFVDGRSGPMNTLKNIPINLKDVKPDLLLTVPALTGNFMKKISDGIRAKGGIAKTLFEAGLKAGNRMFKDGYHQAGAGVKAVNMIQYKLANALVFKKVRDVFGGNLRFCVGGGALLDISQQQFYYAIGAPIYQGYGLTEATPIISANCAHTHKLGSSGRVINNVECRIIKSDGKEAAMGEKGEIVIRGNNVMAGYYKNPEATAETVKDGWLYTGDMGYMDEDNFLIVVGREKALLISEDGEKYSPEGIEEAIINTSDMVMQAMVYNDHKKYTTALITVDNAAVTGFVKQSSITNPRELLMAIEKSFNHYRHTKEYKGKFPEKWLPSRFCIIAEPFSEENKMINSTMKMVRFKITETYQQDIDAMYASSAASIDNEHNLKIANKILEKA